jgi:hypothetical protein
MDPPLRVTLGARLSRGIRAIRTNGHDRRPYGVSGTGWDCSTARSVRRVAGGRDRDRDAKRHHPGARIRIA